MTSSQPEPAASKPDGSIPLHEGVYTLATPRESGNGVLLRPRDNTIAVAVGCAAAAAVFVVVGFGPWFLLAESRNVDPATLPTDPISTAATALILVAAWVAGVCGYICGYKAAVITIERFSFPRSAVPAVRASAYVRTRGEGIAE